MSKFKLFLIGGCVLFTAFPIFAHHGFSMFEMDKNVTYAGVVVEYNWANPHTHIIIKVPQGASDPTTVGTWDVEGGAPSIMARQGWTRLTYKTGDSITLVAHPTKDGSKGASLFYAIRPDGTRLYHDIARPRDDSKDKSEGK
jgi:hypothetical protein